MAVPVKLKRSAVAGKVPVVGDLSLGELAINTTDGKLYLKKSVSGTETVVDIGKDAVTAQQLATARTIGGVPFDGSANINLPGVNTVGNQSTSGNAATATKLATPRSINGTPFDGTANIIIGVNWSSVTNKPADVTGLTAALAGKLALTGGTVTGQVLFSDTTATTSAATGAIVVGGGVGVGGAIYAAGNITAYSDIRLKTDIQVIPDALKKVCSLRGVTYERTDSGERQTGLIAREVRAVLPEAVSGGEYLGVAYGNLVGLLVEAIKELTAKVEVLENGAS